MGVEGETVTQAETSVVPLAQCPERNLDKRHRGYYYCLRKRGHTGVHRARNETWWPRPGRTRRP